MDTETQFYIGDDGRKYCPVCNEPLEALLPERIQRTFQMIYHPRLCACRRAELEKEECERKERERMYEIEKNTSVCFSEHAMREWNFTNDNGSNPCMSYEKQYVDHWDDAKKKNWGLLLWGGAQGKVIWLRALPMLCFGRGIECL